MKINYKKSLKATDKIKESEIIDFILKNRNIKKQEEFLNPPSPVKLKLTDFKKGMIKVINLLEKIKKEGKTIVVYTDYDADGITGGVILWETLNLLGFKVMPYVPHRKKEGYGFSRIGIDNVKRQFDPALMISVDHGISAAEKITYAKSLGIPVVVTDHHLKPEKTPTDALAIFHIPELSGSGVSYFFSKEIFNHFKRSSPEAKRLTTYFSADYLALAAIGTIADLVPLTGPSRCLVKHGLDVFPKVERAGIKCLLKEAGIEGKKITPYEVGFIIAPRINAVGRLEHAIDALRLLCTSRVDFAHKLAHHLGEKNRERQDLVKEAVEQARFYVVKNKLQENKIIILVSSTWHEGIIGLIASKIGEEFYRPTLVLTKCDGYYKGSARSIPGFHITDFLRSLKTHLIDIGGHKQASGFTLEEAKLKDFVAHAQKKANRLIAKKDLEKTIEADIKIPLSRLNMRLAQLIENLQPFGIGNPKPVFVSEAEILDAKMFGHSYEHLKLIVKDANKQSYPLEIVSFSNGKRFSEFYRGQKINIAYNLEIDRWGGSEKLRGRVCCFINNRKDSGIKNVS